MKKIKTTIDDKKIIVEEIVGWYTSRVVIDTSETYIKKALVELGWVPPQEFPDTGWYD